jgi:hypothetical protein
VVSEWTRQEIEAVDNGSTGGREKSGKRFSSLSYNCSLSHYLLLVSHYLEGRSLNLGVYCGGNGSTTDCKVGCL